MAIFFLTDLGFAGMSVFEAGFFFLTDLGFAGADGSAGFFFFGGIVDGTGKVAGQYPRLHSRDK